MKNQRAKTREKRSENIDQIPDPLWTTSGHAPGHAPEAVPLQKQWSCDEPEAVLDYLHGDIRGEEVKACCYYEYARTSQLFRKARSLFTLGLQTDSTSEKESWRVQVACDGVIAAGLSSLLTEWRGLEIVSCDGFPDKPWSELTGQQRQDICMHFVAPRIIPVVTDSFILKKRGVFDQFEKQAESDWADWKQRKGQVRRGQYPAIVGDENHPIRHVVLTLDYSKGVKALEEAVARWLSNEVNTLLFKNYYKKQVDKSNLESPDRYKENLKFLAAWRLCDELGFKGAAEWTGNKRRTREDQLRVRPYFREKKRQKAGGKYFGGPLYQERRQWENTIDKAEGFLAEQIECQRGMT